MSARETITLGTLAHHLVALRPGARVLVALAGPPAVGKSTLAAALCDQVRAGGRAAALVPMDGFHLDDRVLEPRGLLPRKGAPQSFDVAGLTHLLRRLKANAEPEIAVPVFDRSIEISRAGAAMVPASAEVVIVEGNYLLLAQEGWDHLAALFDVTVSLQASEETLRRRLRDRWAELPEAAALAKLEENDLPNGRLVITGSAVADFEITT